MKTSTLPRPQTGTIIWPGSEAIKTTRQQAEDTLKACAFLRETVTIQVDGKRIKSTSIERPKTLTAKQATIAQEELLHQIHFKLRDFLPAGTSVEFIGPQQAPWDDGWMMEIGDGWTLGATIDPQIGYRAAIRWHAYDPEGDPITENATETEAVAALVGRIAAYAVTTNWNKED
jgi:hypothetical protein